LFRTLNPNIGSFAGALEEYVACQGMSMVLNRIFTAHQAAQAILAGRYSSGSGIHLHINVE
jgi:hypothetical protein